MRPAPPAWVSSSACSISRQARAILAACSEVADGSLGLTALAGTESCGLGLGARRIKVHVLALGSPGGTRRPAIDARRRDRGVERPVESLVPRDDRRPAGLIAEGGLGAGRLVGHSSHGANVVPAPGRRTPILAVEFRKIRQGRRARRRPCGLLTAPGAARPGRCPAPCGPPSAAPPPARCGRPTAGRPRRAR